MKSEKKSENFAFWSGIFEFSPRASVLIWLILCNVLKMAVLSSFIYRIFFNFVVFVIASKEKYRQFSRERHFFNIFSVMITTEFTPYEKIDRNFTMCIKIKDHGSMVYQGSFLFGSKTKCYKYLCSIGTVYGKRVGREFQRPLLTYKTFCEFIKTNNLVHVASTGSFDGRFVIQNQKCL